MVVIVIIGVLANVGIPKYQRFMMKARRSEVKSLLTSMYAAQKSFYAEWDQYYADFDVVGFSLAGDQGYMVGFADNRGLGIPFYPDAIYRNNNSAVIINTKDYCDRGSVCTYSRSGALVTNIPRVQWFRIFHRSFFLEELQTWIRMESVTAGILQMHVSWFYYMTIFVGLWS